MIALFIFFFAFNVALQQQHHQQQKTKNKKTNIVMFTVKVYFKYFIKLHYY